MSEDQERSAENPAIDNLAATLSVVSLVSTIAFLLPFGLVMLAILLRDFEGGEQSMLAGLAFVVTAPVTTLCGAIAWARLGYHRARLARWALGLYWLPLLALVLFVWLSGAGNTVHHR